MTNHRLLGAVVPLLAALAGPTGCSFDDEYYAVCRNPRDCHRRHGGPDMQGQPADMGPGLTGGQPGFYVWARALGDTLSDGAYGVASDSAGNVLLAGSFQGTVDFGGGPLTSAGGSDIFVAKYTSAGDYIWAGRFGGAGDDLAYGLAVDPSGNAVVTGAFQGTADFGGGALTSAGDFDVFVARYAAANGDYQWASAYGGPLADSASSVAVDPSGNVLITGTFNGMASFGSALTSTGGADVFLAKLGPTGTALWARGYGGPLDDFANRVAVDKDGNAVVAGYFSGAASFGGTPLQSAGGADAFVARYDATGAPQWAKALGGAGDDVANGVAVDGSGDVVALGVFQGTVSFGGGALTATGPDDIFLARYTPAGAHVWSRHYGGQAPIAAGTVAIDAGGAVVITGTTNASVDLAAAPWAATGSTWPSTAPTPRRGGRGATAACRTRTPTAWPSTRAAPCWWPATSRAAWTSAATPLPAPATTTPSSSSSRPDPVSPGPGRGAAG